jgi:hypothetical protein
MPPVELLGEDPTPRGTEDVRALHPDGVHEPRKTVGPIGHRERLRRVGGPVRARNVPGYDRELVGEIGQLPVPHP